MTENFDWSGVWQKCSFCYSEFDERLDGVRSGSLVYCCRCWLKLHGRPA